MARILLAATPLYGHIRPMTQLARALHVAGHEVTLLAGTTVRLVTEILPELPIDPDGGGRSSSPARGTARRRPRWIHGRDEIMNTFVRPLPAQADALSALVHADRGGERFDAAIADVAFLGVQPLLGWPAPGPR